ncbi:6815_t:CDS:2 [Acaulospora morrowiae]|uniref:6815_t:CDS:1 n=1 Tax=Acaulospora morrowiae TaxID=94023 RepID=A0A9N9CQX0_9GLOM|nr:6815_t:CDS:2 [Acaulospora morrowiae]
MPRVYTLNDVGNSDGNKLGSLPSNRYPPSRLELEEQLKKDREMFIRSAKQLIAKYNALDKKNKCMQNDLDHSHEENELTVKEIESLKSTVKSLENVISSMQKASSKDSDIISLRTKINELEAELEQTAQRVLLKDSDTSLVDPHPSLENRGGLIFCLRSRVSELERQAERDELEQIPLKSHPSSNDSKTGGDEEEEVSSFFAEDTQGKTPSFSSHCPELEPDERKVKNEVESPIDHTEQKSKEKLDSNHPTISPITTSGSGKL